MHKTNTQARRFVAEFLPLVRELDLSRHYLFVIPSFTSLQLVRDAVSEAGLPLKVGAQNVHWEDGVEATGEISARMLADIPVDLGYEQSSHAGSQHSFASERTAGKRIKEKARRHWKHRCVPTWKAFLAKSCPK